MSGRRPWAVAGSTLAFSILLGTAAGGYALINSSRWSDGSITMHLQLGSPSGALIDGTTAWGTSAEAALAEWNVWVSRVRFGVVRDSSAPKGDGDTVNNVFWSSTVHGDQFGSDTLAVTTHWRRGTTRTEADVVFNNDKSWNSYRGALRPSSSGGNLQDIRRVALHEFGHVLHLDHPDQAGQSVQAIMNSRVSNTEVLTADDIAGVQAAYPGSGNNPGPVSVNFPPRNEPLEFRQQLEAKYRDQLRANPSSTFVDIEGNAVWMQEYLRYRVTKCDHAGAQQRVFSQIDGFGIQPACSTPTSLDFPSRADSFVFRQALENKYRDTLRRNASTTSVDVEGDAVWMQEYLRYRVNACGHADAVNRVFQQIDGRGIPATCR